MTLSLCLWVEMLSRRPATANILARTIYLLDLKAQFHPQLLSKSRVPGTFSGQEVPEGADMPQNEPQPNRLSLGASITHVPARSSPAQNRSRRFSVTYICAGKDSPGLGGWVGVAAGVGRRTPQPSTLSGSRPPPSGLRVASVSLLEPFSSPPTAACGRRLKRQAGSRAVLLRGKVCEVGADASASQCPLRPWPGQGDPAPARGGVGISVGCSFLLLLLPAPLS